MHIDMQCISTVSTLFQQAAVFDQGAFCIVCVMCTLLTINVHNDHNIVSLVLWLAIEMCQASLEASLSALFLYPRALCNVYCRHFDTEQQALYSSV